jgi:hypothetical protein
VSELDLKIVPFGKDAAEESLRTFIEMIQPFDGIEYWRYLASSFMGFNEIIEASYERLGYDDGPLVNMILASKACVSIAGYLKYIDMGNEMVLGEEEEALYGSELLQEVSWYELLSILGLSLSKKEILYKPFFEPESFKEHMIGFYKFLHVFFKKGRIDRSKIFPISDLN